MWPFLIGLTIGGAAMSLLGAYALRGWVRENAAHYASRNLLAARSFHLDIARRHIAAIEPLADAGRRAKAHREKQNADRRAARAGRVAK